MIEYDTGDWNKKLSEMDAMGLYSDGYEGWDLDNGKPCSVRVYGIWKGDTDLQKEMLVWADDNCEGYFYQYSLNTEHGTAFVRPGDKFDINLHFQKQEDAVAFKLRWL